MTKPRLRTGGQILVDQLLIHGADMAFCVPGESYLEVLDALYDVRDRFKLINARHEAGAANMAEAYGKLTGRPGICLVTRGPGACHAAVGVHTAFQDSTPMILLVGQVGRDMMDREAFQEIDYRQMFGPVAKWAAQIDVTARIPEYMARAFHVATSGRPGPGGAGAARGHADRGGAVRRRGPLSCRRQAGSRAAGLRRRSATCSRARRGRCCWSAGPAGPTRLRANCSFRRGQRHSGRDLVPPPGYSTTARPASPATSARRARRRWSSASRRPTCCWWSARASAR